MEDMHFILANELSNTFLLNELCLNLRISDFVLDTKHLTTLVFRRKTCISLSK